jgi:hypothetical protein
MNPFAVAIGTVAVASLLCVAPAHANRWQNAVESCQGSLPSFEGSLRKRPLAISNEGSSSAFVSCSMAADLASPSGVTAVAALFTNRTAAAVTVNCTLVSGVAAPFGAPVYLPKALPVAANSASVVAWTSAADNGGDAFVLANLNCTVPVGVEINTVQTDFT